jgi:hypothetical protein
MRKDWYIAFDEMRRLRAWRHPGQPALFVYLDAKAI